MKHNKNIYIVFFALLCLFVSMHGLYAYADNDTPIRMVISVDPETRLETDGIVDKLVFTIINDSDELYTLHDAHLLGGYDGEDRVLSTPISIEAHSSKEFTLHDIPVKEDQLDTDIIYTLSWYEFSEAPVETSVPEENNVSSENESEGSSDDGLDLQNSVDYEAEIVKTERKIDAVIRIEKFIIPVLNVSASVSSDAVQSGNTFTVTYTIFNDTKYDMSSIKLNDIGVSSEPVELPDSNLMAGQSVTVEKECVMGEEDILIHPVISYIAAQRQTETEAEETITVSSVIIGIKLDVQQYPSNEEGTVFAVTVTNTGNRAMTDIQLYDEINSEIDEPFDLGPQQQKAITFQVPSAYASGLIRNVQFHLTCKDYFNNTFSFMDANSYECVPFISSDAVRLSILPVLAKAYYDDSGKLCGTIQIEIRNYSDVRVIKASLRELSIFGNVQDFDELQRGETIYTIDYQLDNIKELTFQLDAHDTTGVSYTTEAVKVDLSQLESLASATEEKPVIYHSNAYLKGLIEKFTFSLKNIVSIVLIIIIIGCSIGFVLWIVENNIRSKLPRESLMSIKAPEAKDTSNTSIDQVLAGSPAEQLGYRAPAKIRYGEMKSGKNNNQQNYSQYKAGFASSFNQLHEINKMRFKKSDGMQDKENIVQQDVSDIIVQQSISMEDIKPNLNNDLNSENISQHSDSYKDSDFNENAQLYPDQPNGFMFAEKSMDAEYKQAEKEQSCLNGVQETDENTVVDENNDWTFAPVVFELRKIEIPKKYRPNEIIRI